MMAGSVLERMREIRSVARTQMDLQKQLALGAPSMSLPALMKPVSDDLGEIDVCEFVPGWFDDTMPWARPRPVHGGFGCRWRPPRVNLSEAPVLASSLEACSTRRTETSHA